jgi:hypothetical protein
MWVHLRSSSQRRERRTAGRKTALRRGQPSAPVPASRTPEHFCHQYQRLARGAGGARGEERARSGPALSCRLISVRKLLRQSALALPRECCTPPRCQPHPQPQTPPRPPSWARLGRISPLVAPSIPPGRAGAAPRCGAENGAPGFPSPARGKQRHTRRCRKARAHSVKVIRSKPGRFPHGSGNPCTCPPVLGPFSAFRGGTPEALHQGHTGALRGGVRHPTRLGGVLGEGLGVGTSVGGPGLASFQFWRRIDPIFGFDFLGP